MKYTTTLNKIREHDPCANGWRKLLDHLGKTEADDEPLPLSVILDSNGLSDALWALRTMPEHDDTWRLLGCDYAAHVLHLYEDKYPDDNRPRNAIEVARLHAQGLASDEELAAAGAAAWDAARAAAWAYAWDAARAAAWAAARAAAGAAERDAVGDAERAWQKERLREIIEGGE